MTRNAEGGYVAPAPGGYQREYAATFGSGTDAMVVGPVWSCKVCLCRGVLTSPRTVVRRICNGSCDCHGKAQP